MSRAVFARIERLAEAFTKARIPNLYGNALKESFYSKEVLDCLERQSSKDSTKNPLYFFYGEPGTGKTHSSIFLLMNFVKTFPNKTAYYSTSYSIVEKKRSASAFSYDAKILKDEAELQYKTSLEKLKSVDFLVFDEIGQERLTEPESKVIFNILDHRYAANKITILISNHSDTRELSLDRKLLSSLVGDRISSRVKSARAVYFSGRDHRVRDENVAELISKEEIAGFNMGEASPKLMMLDDNTHHIMNWLARNPAFETVETRRRNSLTGIVDGKPWDKDRPEASLYKDVWGTGASLIVAGPVCDQEDMKLYACLLKELTESHKNGNQGLTLKISHKSILRLMGLEEAGKSLVKVQRQLNRLNRMSLNFRSTKGKRWSGPLLAQVIYDEDGGDGRSTKIRITFNHYMITFYRAHEYLTLNKDLFWTLSGDSATLFAFYTSHDYPVQKLPLEQVRLILAIPETTPKKAVVRRIQAALKKLLTTGIFDAQNTKFKNDVLHTARSSTSQSG